MRSFEKRFLSYRERRAIPGHFGSSPRTCFQKIVARTAPKSRLYSRYSHSTSDCATPRHGRNLPRTGEPSTGAERLQWNRRNKDEPKTLAAGIVLLHDLQKNTAEAAPELLRQPNAGGYKIVHIVPKDALTTLAKYDNIVRHRKSP